MAPVKTFKIQVHRWWELATEWSKLRSSKCWNRTPLVEHSTSQHHMLIRLKACENVYREGGAQSSAVKPLCLICVHISWFLWKKDGLSWRGGRGRGKLMKEQISKAAFISKVAFSSNSKCGQVSPYVFIGIHVQCQNYKPKKQLSVSNRKQTCKTTFLLHKILHMHTHTHACVHIHSYTYTHTHTKYKELHLLNMATFMANFWSASCEDILSQEHCVKNRCSLSCELKNMQWGNKLDGYFSQCLMQVQATALGRWTIKNQWQWLAQLVECRNYTRLQWM